MFLKLVEIMQFPHQTWLEFQRSLKKEILRKQFFVEQNESGYDTA